MCEGLKEGAKYQRRIGPTLVIYLFILTLVILKLALTLLDTRLVGP